MQVKGTVFHIQRFCVNDGPGIRTTVFLKGCPLDCIWCHNPESKQMSRSLFYDGTKCIGCGGCVSACAHGCHTIAGGVHTFDRTDCTQCGSCAEACFTGALEAVGTSVTVEEVLNTVLRDMPFYQKSGGGLTVSGGEPMMQADFTRALLKAAKEHGISTAMETCGYAKAEQIADIAPYTDWFLYDCKAFGADHIRFTGVDNTRILENLRLLDRLGAHIILRCPIVPDCNDSDAHFASIAALANELPHIEEIQIEPYHPLGSSKSKLLAVDYPLLPLTFPEPERIAAWIACIQNQTATPVRQA